MSVALLGVNVLIALAWPNQLHHRFASDWIDANWRLGWAACPITQCGFVRISSNPRLSPASATPAKATELLSGIISLPGHVFCPDDIQLPDVVTTAGRSLVVGHLQVTDAYLISLAMHHGGRLATFDKRATAIVGTKSPAAIEIIPVIP